MRKAANQKPGIVFIVPAIAHEGISKQVLLQIGALLKKHYDVKLVVLTTVERSVLATFAPGFSPEKVLELKQPDAYLSVRSLKSSVSVALQIKHFLRREYPQVIFAHAPYAHFVMRLAMLLSKGKYSDIKLWQYFHITQYAEYPLKSLRRKLINKLNKWLAGKFDFGHIFVSESVKADVQSHLIKAKNCKVIYNAVLQPSVQVLQNDVVKADERIFRILLPGRVEASKGQLWFTEPLQEFIWQEQLGPDQVQVVVAGEGSQVGKLQQEIVQQKLQAFVKIVGKIPNSELMLLMQQSSLVVVPSFTEGLPLVILEALQQKAIVLASDIAPNREVISSKEIGFLFKAGSTADCVAKMQFIYQHRDQQLIDKAAIEGLLNSKFSFEKHMQNLIAVIESV